LADNRLLVEIIDGEIRFHVVRGNSKADPNEARAARKPGRNSLPIYQVTGIGLLRAFMGP